MSARSRDRKHAYMALSHERSLIRYLRRRVRKPEDVDDLVQEIYLRILSLDDSMEIREPLALLHQVANWMLGSFRRLARRNELIAVDSEIVDRRMEEMDDCAQHDIADQIDLQRRLQQALAALPRTHAAVLLLHKRDGLSYEEVAASLNISVHTVKTYMKEALAQFRALAWEQEEQT